MAKWIESGTYRFTYGDKTADKANDKNFMFWYPDYEALQAGLEKTLRWLRRRQWKICAVTPLTASRIYKDHEKQVDLRDKHAYSWGISAGTTPIIGMVIFAQREIEITDEEYALRMGALQKKERLEKVKNELPGLQAAVQKDQELNLNIEEKKGLLGGAKFILNDTTYKTREEAEEMLASLKAGCTQRAGALEAMQREFQQLSAEVQDLENKYGALEEAW